MANSKSSEHNTHIDPEYPFRSWLNENGETVYSIPLEMPEDSTAESPLGTEDERTCTFIRFFGGKLMCIHFVESTDKAAAYNQCSYLNTLYTRERRYGERYRLLDFREKEDPSESIWDYSPAMHRNDDGYTLAEYSDIPEQIEELIRCRFRTNELYLEVYRLRIEGFRPKEISERLGIDQAMVYYYEKQAQQVAQEYRRQYFDEGQYVFPAPERKHRKKCVSDFTSNKDNPDRFVRLVNDADRTYNGGGEE